MAETPPEPDEIFERTRAEGARRLARGPLELTSTAFLAGVDVVFGIVALGTAHHFVASRFGEELGTLAGALAFGVAFIFIVVGRSELFTENFLVPIAGLDRRNRGSWGSLAQLWTISPIFNLIGGALLILVVTTQGVLPEGTGGALVTTAEKLDENSLLAAFMSAIAAGALITLVTWLVEGATSTGIRVLCAYVGGVLLTLGTFNHVIVVTLEIFAGIRYGADIGWGDLGQNFAVAAVGNLVGGVLFVTLTRTSQARAAAKP
ncbi:MAG TPA: formate/nitrite transporter family protein [Gaiellaceae bacterium]|nr:formate/nitrite transporter family protein [Gaiellaceae bacterium]